MWKSSPPPVSRKKQISEVPARALKSLAVVVINIKQRRCVTLINITDCAAKSVLFAVAFHARKCFGAATPSELYDCIKHRGHITMILNLLIEKVAYSRHGPTSA